MESFRDWLAGPYTSYPFWYSAYGLERHGTELLQSASSYFLPILQRLSPLCSYFLLPALFVVYVQAAAATALEERRSTLGLYARIEGLSAGTA